MKISSKISLIITLILLSIITPIGSADGEDFEPSVLTGEFLVGLKEVDGDVNALIAEKNLEVVRIIKQINVLLVRARDDVTTQEVKDTLASSQMVRFVEPNYRVKIPQPKFGGVIEASFMRPYSQVGSTSTPDDPLWLSDTFTGQGQWNMRVIDIDDAWSINMGSHNVVVAVLDTGVFSGHHDLEANYLPGGYDWVNGDEDPSDDNGHGSWVAGIIAAETNNSYGVAGISQTSIIAEKVLGRMASGSLADLISGIVHAADLRADIINMSLGTDSYSAALEDAVNYAYGRGCLLVAAAGNRDTNNPHYPAALENVIAVASTYGEPNDVRAPYSNYGSWITIAAPGGWDENRDGSPNKGEHWVISTSNRQDLFYIGYGTSAATPHVSGLAALYKSHYPTATNREIEEVIGRTAVDKGDLGWDELYGYGRIDAYKALTSPLITSVGGEGEIISLHRMSTVASWISLTLLMSLTSISSILIKRRNASISRAIAKRTI